MNSMVYTSKNMQGMQEWSNDKKMREKWACDE
jgi:hypothetical protein